MIAAVHGYCLAGATLLCVFTAITGVAEDAKIGLPSIPRRRPHHSTVDIAGRAEAGRLLRRKVQEWAETQLAADPPESPLWTDGS